MELELASERLEGDRSERDLMNIQSVNGQKSELQSTASFDKQDEAPLLMKAEESSEKEDESTRNGIIATADSITDMESKYAAYVRHDTYGTMGKGDISVQEKALLVLALIIIVPVKVALLLGILIVYYAICRVCTLCKSSLQEEGQENYAYLTGWRRSVIVFFGRFFARAMLFVLGFVWIKVAHKDLQHLGSSIKEDTKDEPRSEEDYHRPGAIISNHVSYIDILYHMSASFPSFVAKRSVARLPLVGLISKCLGCLYVQREGKSSNFKGVSGMVAGRLEAAHANKNAPVMMLFPEGTTTNGDFLLPFKTGAFLSQTPVQPVILKYPYKRFSPAWDTISGVRHLILLLCQFVNHLEVVCLPVYVPSEKEKHDPKLYAENVRNLMAVEGNLTLSNIGLYEKRIYHAALNGSLFKSEICQLRDYNVFTRSSEKWNNVINGGSGTNFIICCSTKVEFITMFSVLFSFHSD